MPDVMLVDLNNVVAANTHANLSLTTADGTPTGGVYGAIRSVRAMLIDELSEYRFSKIIFIRDAGRPAFRTELCSTYKAGREKQNENPKNVARGRAGPVAFGDAYRKQKKIVGKFLRPLGIDVAWSEGWEADDVIALHARELHNHDRVVIVSGDKDMLQLVEKGRVAVYMPARQELVEKVPKSYLLRRCIEGDSSDVIPGLTGLGAQRAVEIVESGNYRTPKQLLAGYRGRWWEPPKSKAKEGARRQLRLSDPEAQKRLRTNWKVMSLRHSVLLMTEAGAQVKTRDGVWKPDVFLDLCAEYEFESVLGDPDVFLRPFRVVHRRARKLL